MSVGGQHNEKAHILYNYYHSIHKLLAGLEKLSDAQLPRIGYEATPAGRKQATDEILAMYRASPRGGDSVGGHPPMSNPPGPQFTDGRKWPPPIFCEIHSKIARQ